MPLPAFKCPKCHQNPAPILVTASGRRVCPCFFTWEPPDDSKYLAPAPQGPLPATSTAAPSQNPPPAAPGWPTAPQTAPLAAKPTLPPGIPPTQNTTPAAPAGPTPVSGLSSVPPLPIGSRPTATPHMRCPSCHQTLRKKNPHTMDSQKIRVLEDIAKLNAQGNEWVFAKAGEFLELEDKSRIRTAYRAQAHTSRLVWFGLVDHKGPRTGLYRVNKNGFEFLAGKLSVPQTIYCREGIVTDRTQEEVRIYDVKDVVLDKPYWDNYFRIQV
jgi:hypothetical protein